jgi:hypothetical protein
MLLRCFLFLNNRKILSGFLVVLYSLAIIFLHDFFVKISVVVMNSYSLPVYNVLVRNVFGGVGVLSFLLLLTKCIRAKNAQLLFYLFISTVLIVLHALFLFEMNIEIIHAIEYALLALLVYSLCGRFGAAVIFCIPLMLIDEWRQYLVLYPGYTQYFEFNDIVMDVIGCGFAMLSLKILGVDIKSKPRVVFFLREEFLFLVILSISYFLLLQTCVFAYHISVASNTTIISLSLLENPYSFWQIHDFTKAKYHVLSPITGFVVIFCLSVFFMGLDGYSSTAKTSPSKMV